MFKTISNTKEFSYSNENTVKSLVNLVNNSFGVLILPYHNFHILEDDNAILAIEIYASHTDNIELTISLFIYFKFIPTLL